MSDETGLQERDILILVVEDSPTQLQRLKHLLEGEGYGVFPALSAKEALLFLGHTKADLVLSDVVMPDLDGYALCKTIKEDPSLEGMPVILLTMLSEPGDVIKGLESGADNFINKPYEDEFLLSRIDYILLNRELRNGHSPEMGIEILFAGKRHFITSDRIQMLDLLLSTYDSAVMKNRELELANRQLKEANEKIKTLKGLIPICAHCKKIRDDNGFWTQLEEFISKHSEAEFSHGYCPSCVKELYPQYCDRLGIK